MHRVGGEAWAVSVSGGHADHIFALYVREALDLPTRIEVPEPLVPTVPAADVALSATDRRSAAADWTTWWRTLLASRWQSIRGVPLPPGRPLDVTGPDQLLLDPSRVQPSTPLTSGVAAVSRGAQDYVRHRGDHTSPRHLGAGLDYRSLVAALARDLGRRPRDFRLEIEILPVDGSRAWTVGIDPDRAHAYLQITEDFATHPQRHRPVIAHTLARIF